MASDLVQDAMGAALRGCSCEREPTAFVRILNVPLGLGESWLSFKLSTLFPGFSQAWFFILANHLPRFSQVCLLLFRVAILVPGSCAPREQTSPVLSSPFPILGRTPGVAVNLSQA